MDTPVNICNDHLISLYEAIEHDDIALVRKVSHQLTSEEECVACAYALKARGPVQYELKKFLKREGFAVDIPAEDSAFEKISFVFVRLGTLVILLLLIMNLAAYVKSFISQIPFRWEYSSFGWVGIMLMTLASFVFVEYEFFE